MGWGGGRGGVGVVAARVDSEEMPHWQTLSLLESNGRARQTLVAAKYTLEAANTNLRSSSNAYFALRSCSFASTARCKSGFAAANLSYDFCSDKGADLEL